MTPRTREIVDAVACMILQAAAAGALLAGYAAALAAGGICRHEPSRYLELFAAGATTVASFYAALAAACLISRAAGCRR